MNRKEKIIQVQWQLLFIIVLFITPIVKSSITQEWLFWPSDSNGKLKVNSADNVSKITNANKSETLNLRYSITDELKSFNNAKLNPIISSIDLTYFSSELLKREKFSNDKHFIPLFGNYETGLHIALTTKEEINNKKEINQIMDETCQFINKLFAYSGYTLCKKQDLVYFTDIEKIGAVTPKHYYMYIANFNFEKIEGYSLYHIFNLSQKQDLELGCDFDDEVIDDWTSKYFNIVISRHPNMLDDKDNNQKNDDDEEGGEENNTTVMIKFEEILHFKFPESSKCKVNLHLNEVSVIDDMKKTENNGYLIKNINPRGKKNDELVFIPCPLPKIKFNYNLSAEVGLHPALTATIETQEWMENQPILMLFTLDPNIFADEYQINGKRKDFEKKGFHISVYGHPDLEVAVNDKQAKFNFVKVVINHMAPFSKKTIEIPLHLRYPESYQEKTGNSDKNSNYIFDNKVNSEKTKKNKNVEDGKEEGENNNENENENYDERQFKKIFINPPRFYTTSNKLCHQNSFSSSSLPMLILSSIEKDRNRAASSSIIPVRTYSLKAKVDDSIITTTSSSSSANQIPPLEIDVPRGKISNYNTISIITLVVTLSGIVIIIYSITRYSKFNPSQGLDNIQYQKLQSSPSSQQQQQQKLKQKSKKQN